MQNEEIISKFKTIENAKLTLKKEFVGIDNVIDTIIDNVRGWYVFPDLQTKPITICLWGLTGCGKTSLVNRLCELLDIKEDMCIYNLAKIGEEDSEDIEDKIINNMGNAKANRVFVFDEFQFAAAIDSEGKEKDNKTCLKTIWEVIDTGKFHKEFYNHYKNKLSTSVMLLKTVCELGGVVKNGVLENDEKVFKILPIEKKGDFAIQFNPKCNLGEFEEYKNTGKKYWCELMDCTCNNDTSFWLSCDMLGQLYEITFVIGEHNMSYAEYVTYMRDMSTDDVYKYAARIQKAMRGGYDVNFSKSLVFVMGNIDEAYEMAYNVDPDMEPDQFRIKTERMTLVDIKEALGVRFRNEQIARLGNIMLLYPSFSKKNFEDIIKLYLENYAKSVKNGYGIDMTYDNSIYDIIYKDGVFPTHGTRPVFSSAYEIVQTKLPSIIMHAVKNDRNVSEIHFKYENEFVIADFKCKDGSRDTIEFKQQLRLEGKRKNKSDENQAVTAVHESGHFVMYHKLFGKLPAKLVSGTVSQNANGFMQQDDSEETSFMTVDDCIREIAVCLAGYAAECEVFGKDSITTGASEDIMRATILASRMVRECGMNVVGATGEPCATTYLNDPFATKGGLMLFTENNDEVNRCIRQILSEAMNIVKDTYKDKDWMRMLLKSAEWLSCNIAMPKSVMEDMVKLVDETKRKECVRGEYFFRDTLKRRIEEMK